MGYFPGEFISSAAQFVLRELKTRKAIKYSQFYDGTEETAARVARETNIDDPKYYSPELAIDLAVFELENEDLVVREDLDDALPDGEPDYLIQLTKRGVRFIRDGKLHVSRGQEL